ncbi:MAG: hypothetical protein AB7N76_27970 [Planctomycetota bacterium]
MAQPLTLEVGTVIKNLFAAFLALSILSCPPAATLWAKDPAPKKGDKKEKEEPVHYAVVDIDGTLSVKTMKELKEMPKQMDKEYKEAVANWDKAKKEAKKNKQKFDEKKPTKPKVKVVAQNLKDEAAAQAVIAKIEEAKNKGKKKGGDSKSGKDKEDSKTS